MKEREVTCYYCEDIFLSSGPGAKFCSKRCKKKVEWQKHRDHRNASDNPMKPHGGNHTGKVGRDHYAYRDGIGLFSMRLSREYKTHVRYCERCSKDLAEALPQFWCVHHVDHDRTHNTYENFELLCKRCHQIEHECWKAFG